MAIKNQPSSVSATQWGKTVTIAVEHSDVDLYELLEMFKGLAVGLEYSEDSWRKVIKELGELYTEEDADNEIDGFVRGLNESEIDAALAEHNRHEEELEEWDTTNLDGLPKVDPTNL
jgi:ABC-type Fe2+-enterobactin transport system substrate-binding protein